MEKVTASSFLPHKHKPLESKEHLMVGRNGRLSIHKPGVDRKSMEALSAGPGSVEWEPEGQVRKRNKGWVPLLTY